MRKAAKESHALICTLARAKYRERLAAIKLTFLLLVALCSLSAAMGRAKGGKNIKQRKPPLEQCEELPPVKQLACCGYWLHIFAEK